MVHQVARKKKLFQALQVCLKMPPRIKISALEWRSLSGICCSSFPLKTPKASSGTAGCQASYQDGSRFYEVHSFMLGSRKSQHTFLLSSICFLGTLGLRDHYLSCESNRYWAEFCYCQTYLWDQFHLPNHHAYFSGSRRIAFILCSTYWITKYKKIYIIKT